MNNSILPSCLVDDVDVMRKRVAFEILWRPSCVVSLFAPIYCVCVDMLLVFVFVSFEVAWKICIELSTTTTTMMMAGVVAGSSLTALHFPSIYLFLSSCGRSFDFSIWTKANTLTPFIRTHIALRESPLPGPVFSLTLSISLCLCLSPLLDGCVEGSKRRT